ncbi:MAG: hypothetical protein JWN82_267 [Candidatus Saccharibacteria bacterium]|nr:hypothetical protein [Candidatus Saccharibacteria bacterium]
MIALMTPKAYTNRYMKLLITVGLVVFGSLGAWLGGALDHGNILGPWLLLFSTLGSFVGIWVGYKAGKNWLG